MNDRLTEDMKQAMRLGDTTRRDAVRYLRSAVKNLEIERREPPTDEAIIELMGKQAQQRRESIEAFRKFGRDDLVTKEEAELAVIMEYLPAQLSDDEITQLAGAAIDESGAAGPQDMGKVMGRIMPQIRGKAEGKKVSGIVASLLKGLP